MTVYDLLKLFRVDQEITISAKGCEKPYKGLVRDVPYAYTLGIPINIFFIEGSVYIFADILVSSNDVL
ncbi:hypothetical protein [uncultured Thomasclavelia sp.]|uniref:hypothetical protein n=1 Tax=uncultured Thomasclavelia sp. TaxID=3025759 RepID=UPI002595F27B|nr:hypothetical protein [uncultured Thomasclavelia sp.]